MDYLHCADAASGTAEDKAKKCAAEASPALPWADISACKSGDEGAAFEKAAATYFDGLFPKPVGVPHIEINGKAITGDREYNDIIRALCATGITAGACKNIDIMMV